MQTDFDWRNHDVHHIVVNEDLTHVRPISFRDITLPLHNMHPSANNYGVAQDCTHFCYFPQMWQSVWHELYVATVNSTTAAPSRWRRRLRALRSRK